MDDLCKVMESCTDPIETDPEHAAGSGPPSSSGFGSRMYCIRPVDSQHKTNRVAAHVDDCVQVVRLHVSVGMLGCILRHGIDGEPGPSFF